MNREHDTADHIFLADHAVPYKPEPNIQLDPSVLLGMTEMLRQVMTPMAEMMRRNVEALERVASAQKVQNDRIEGLERQVRLNTPVTGTQAKYLGTAIKQRADAHLTKYGIANPAATKKLCNVIRKSVLVRYGIGGMRELPRHEYQPALNLIERWIDAPAILRITKEFREVEGDAGGT